MNIFKNLENLFPKLIQLHTAAPVAAAMGPVGWGLMGVSALVSIFGGGAKKSSS
jgi:hypothetical protein